MPIKTHSVFDPGMIFPAIGESFKKLSPSADLQCDHPDRADSSCDQGSSFPAAHSHRDFDPESPYLRSRRNPAALFGHQVDRHVRYNLKVWPEIKNITK